MTDISSYIEYFRKIAAEHKEISRFYMMVINGEFLIIDHLQNPDDFQGEMALIDRMKQIRHQVIARMLHDYLKCEPLTLKAIPGFNINSVSYEMLGPVFDNDFGVIFSFRIQDCAKIMYDKSVWIAK